MATDEERWVREARQGDRAAFRRLVEAHARPLFALCSRITREQWARVRFDQTSKRCAVSLPGLLDPALLVGGHVPWMQSSTIRLAPILP